MSAKTQKKNLGKQQLIWNFTVKKSDILVKSEPKLKRSYEEMVRDLLENARKIMGIKKEEEGKDTNEEKEGKKILKRKYHKYSVEEKEALLALLPYMTLAEIEKEFGVRESTIRSWQQKTDLKDKRVNNGKKPILSELEAELKELIIKMRSDGIPVTSIIIMNEIKGLYMKKYKLNEDDYKFLKKFAQYAHAKNITALSINMKPFNEKWFTYSEDLSEEELKLDEKIRLRDLLISSLLSLIYIGFINFVQELA